MSCVFVNAGQCGNQVGFAIIDAIFDHISTLPENEFEREVLEEMFFRTTNKGRKKRLLSRTVCLDTEPKVVEDCLLKAHYSNKWRYDVNSAAYMHGGMSLPTVEFNSCCV